VALPATLDSSILRAVIARPGFRHPGQGGKARARHGGTGDEEDSRERRAASSRKRIPIGIAGSAESRRLLGRLE
jgi:hypothetical protein